MLSHALTSSQDGHWDLCYSSKTTGPSTPQRFAQDDTSKNLTDYILLTGSWLFLLPLFSTGAANTSKRMRAMSWPLVGSRSLVHWQSSVMLKWASRLSSRPAAMSTL